jgi:hypothetical protein
VASNCLLNREKRNGKHCRIELKHDLMAAEAVKSGCNDESRSSPTRLLSAAVAYKHFTQKRAREMKIEVHNDHAHPPH